MDDRLLYWLIREVRKIGKRKQADMAIAVRQGFGADQAQFREYIQDLVDSTSREDRVEDNWEMLRQVGGG